MMAVAMSPPHGGADRNVLPARPREWCRASRPLTGARIETTTASEPIADWPARCRPLTGARIETLITVP